MVEQAHALRTVRGWVNFLRKSSNLLEIHATCWEIRRQGPEDESCSQSWSMGALRAWRVQPGPRAPSLTVQAWGRIPCFQRSLSHNRNKNPSHRCHNNSSLQRVTQGVWRLRPVFLSFSSWLTEDQWLKSRMFSSVTFSLLKLWPKVWPTPTHSGSPPSEKFQIIQ